MSKPTDRPPRMFAFVWFIAAAGVLGGAVLLRALGISDAFGVDEGSSMTFIYVMCAFFVGQGVGEWRGLRYAAFWRERSSPAA